VSTDVTWHASAVERADRWAAMRAEGATIWLTGLSGSGKSTIAVDLERRLVHAGRPAYLLDGDNLRFGLNADLGFSREDRDENVRRVGEVALLLADAGMVAIAPLVSPHAGARARVRASHERAGLRFLEVHVSTPLEECERRDPKGLYAKARGGELANMTGITDPYEPPTHADVVVDAQVADVPTCVDAVLDALLAGARRR
jgi:bifunctional enzyme CysN/CysC